MIMVRVNLKDQDSVVGLLLDTHLVPMSGPPKATIGEGGQLMQTQGQQGVQGFGVVATDQGFLVGPLSSMTPMLQPDEVSNEEKSDDDAPNVPAELRSGEGRKEEGE